MSNLEWAMTYHMAGWSIFPCKDKKPHFKLLADAGYTKDGKASWERLQDEQTDEDTVIKWWTEDPTAQIAVACGPVSGITVADIDTKVFDPVTKEKILGKLRPDEILASLRTISSPTLVSRTGSGGIHAFYAFHPVLNSQKTIHPQIDVKSYGGYVILPPSPHDSGTPYTWVDGLSWNPSARLAPFPQQLVRHEKKGKVDYQNLAKGALQGGRHITLVTMAGSLIAKYRNELHIAWALLESYNATKIKPPKTEKELIHIFTSLIKSDIRNNQS